LDVHDIRLAKRPASREILGCSQDSLRQGWCRRELVNGDAGGSRQQ
jgi:hypothetical protein